MDFFHSAYSCFLNSWEKSLNSPALQACSRCLCIAQAAWQELTWLLLPRSEDRTRHHTASWNICLAPESKGQNISIRAHISVAALVPMWCLWRGSPSPTLASFLLLYAVPSPFCSPCQATALQLRVIRKRPQKSCQARVASGNHATSRGQALQLPREREQSCGYWVTSGSPLETLPLRSPSCQAPPPGDWTVQCDVRTVWLRGVDVE